MLKTYCINHLGIFNKRPKDGRRGEKVYAKQYQATKSNSPNCILFMPPHPQNLFCAAAVDWYY